MIYFAVGYAMGVLTCLLYFQIKKEKVEKPEPVRDNGKEHLILEEEEKEEEQDLAPIEDDGKEHLT